MSELRGLGAINDELEKAGVKIVAISTDSPKAASRVVTKNKLPFPILSDPERRTIGAYGLVHQGGGPGNADISLPAHILIGRDGRILWLRIAKLIQDRPSPDETLQHVTAALGKP